MIAGDEIQYLRELPIESVAERLGLMVNGHKSLCPFHQDSHPSLTYNVKRNRFCCYVCNAKGNAIDLVMRTMNYNFVQACNWLSYGKTQMAVLKPACKPQKEHTYSIETLERFIEYPVLHKQAKAFLFEERKLNPAVIRWLGISSTNRPMGPYKDSPSLLIPYRDTEGKLLTLQSRYLGKTDNLKVPRFRFPRGCKCHIYNQPVLKLLRRTEPLFISEGVTDCMALLSAGHKAIAIPSATLLNDTDLKVLKDLEQRIGMLNLHIYPDNDEPGEKLFLQLRRTFPQIVRHQLPADCKDFSELYLKQIKRPNYGD